jgi:hypothetical protein
METTSKSTIEELKKLTVKKDQDLAIPADYFFTLMEDPTFLNRSMTLREDEDFYKLLLTPVHQYYGKTVKIITIMLVKIKRDQFVHGSFLLSNQSMGAFYFFEDIQMGMAIVNKAGMSHFFRITAFKGGAEASPDAIMAGAASLSSAFH